MLSKAAETGSQALGRRSRRSRRSSSPSSTRQPDEAGRWASRERGRGEDGEDSDEPAKVAAPVVQQGIKVGVEGVPPAGELARKTVTAVDSGVRDVTPVVDELFAAVIEPATVERVEGGIIGACKVAFGRLAAGCARWRMWSHPMPATAA